MALSVSRVRRFTCLACHYPMEAGDSRPLSQIPCPACKKPQTVPARLFDFVLRHRMGAVVAGDIFRGIEETSGRDVDIIVMESDAGERAAMVSATVRLYKTLCKLDHPYLHRIHRFMACEDHPIIVTEPRGESISSLIGKRGVHPVKWLHLAIQAACGFRAAEGVGICHMALQPAHFQLRPDFTVRMMGFSLWNHLSSVQPSNGWSNVAPAAYLAPEVARGERPDVRSDIYAFGVCLLYFLTRQAPADKLNARQILRIEQDIIPSDMVDAFSAMLMEKPADRPGNWNEVIALLKGESPLAVSPGVASPGMEKADAQEDDAIERSAPVRPRMKRYASGYQPDFIGQPGALNHSGFLHGMMSADVELGADDVLGQLHDMAGLEDAAEFASEQIAAARSDGPVDIMAKAVLDGDLDDIRPEDIGSGLIAPDALLDSGITLTPLDVGVGPGLSLMSPTPDVPLDSGGTAAMDWSELGPPLPGEPKRAGGKP